MTKSELEEFSKEQKEFLKVIIHESSEKEKEEAKIKFKNIKKQFGLIILYLIWFNTL